MRCPGMPDMRRTTSFSTISETRVSCDPTDSTREAAPCAIAAAWAGDIPGLQATTSCAATCSAMESDLLSIMSAM